MQSWRKTDRKAIREAMDGGALPHLVDSISFLLYESQEICIAAHAAALNAWRGERRYGPSRRLFRSNRGRGRLILLPGLQNKG